MPKWFQVMSILIDHKDNKIKNILASIQMLLFSS